MSEENSETPIYDQLMKELEEKQIQEISE